MARVTAVVARAKPVMARVVVVASVEVVDDAGCTPLHLVTSRDILLLVVHGTATRPSLCARNGAGLTPAETVAPELAELMRSPDGEDPERGSAWLHAAGSPLERSNLFSFLLRSPARTAPARCRSNCSRHARSTGAYVRRRGVYARPMAVPGAVSMSMAACSSGGI